MKKVLIVFLFVGFMPLSIFSQESGISFEVDYPLIFPDQYNTYSDTSGILGGTLQYQISDNIPFNYGLEYKFDLIQATEILGVNNPKASKRTFLISNLNAFVKMLFLDVPELQLYATGGFTTYKYRPSKSIPAYIGYNVGAGFTYDVMDRTYLLASYSYIQAKQKNYDGTQRADDTHQLIRLGFGFLF